MARPGRMLSRLARHLVSGSRPPPPPLPAPPDAADWTALVTGASSGIGLETACGLAAMGMRVLLVGRSPDRTRDALERVTRSSPGARAEALLADFSNLAEVRRLAGDVLARAPRLNLLINNAGVWHPRRVTSADGFEDTLAVNHLAPFLLTCLLEERLQKSAPARVVTVSSRLHRKPRSLELDDLCFERRPYHGMRAYQQSKLCNVLFSNHLARRLEGSGVSSNSVHPGDVATDVARDSRVGAAALRLIRPMLLTPAEGAQTSLYAATAAELAGISGRYFSDMQDAQPNPLALDGELSDQLWQWSERAVGVT
jgi:NAD(P)-dependent dehydrogenase (short-subunit alcohol dehydrogenase family)